MLGRAHSGSGAVPTSCAHGPTAALQVAAEAVSPAEGQLLLTESSDALFARHAVPDDRA